MRGNFQMGLYKETELLSILTEEFTKGLFIKTKKKDMENLLG